MLDKTFVKKMLKHLKEKHIYIPSKGMFIANYGKFNGKILAERAYNEDLGRPRCLLLGKRVAIASLVYLYEVGEFVKPIYHRDGDIRNTEFSNLTDDPLLEFSALTKVELIKLKFSFENGEIVRHSIMHKLKSKVTGHQAVYEILVRLNHYDRIPLNDIAWVLHYGEEPNGFVYNKNGNMRDVSKENLAIGIRPDKRYKDPLCIADRHKQKDDSVVSMASIRLR